MPTLLDSIASYLPTLSVRRLNDEVQGLEAPRNEVLETALLFADISGFTPLAERLAQEGPAGIEELSVILNDYFGKVINLIYSQGGDIVKFAGDALIAVWPKSEADEDLSTLTLRAAQCALDLQGLLSAEQLLSRVQLSMRVGVGAGEVTMVQVGGVDGRWELLFVGEPLIQVGTVEHSIQPGEVSLTPLAWDLLRDQATGTPIPTGGVRLESLDHRLALRETPLLVPSPQAVLQAHLPKAISSRLMAGQTDWLAELRQSTVLFIKLPDLDRTAGLELAQRITATVQSVLNRFEGTLNKLSLDEKGVSLVAIWGLPPFVHEDDALRGVQAALELRTALQALGVRSAMGLASGRVFCGEIGNSRRREYTVIGDVVNTAARLMQAAGGDLLCDAATQHACHSRMAFEAAEPVTLKGKSAPMAVFRPRGELKRTGASVVKLIGREFERSLLTERLEVLMSGKSTGAVVIEAEAGMGKSSLLADFVQAASRSGVTVLTGAGDAIERTTPYFAWRSVFSTLFRLEDVQEGQRGRAEHIGARLSEFNEPAHIAPLLSTILATDIPDNETTLQIQGAVRADNTHELLLRLLQRAADRKPLVLVVEDAHWLDSASWTLLGLAFRRLTGVQLVMATRPFGASAPADYRRLLDLPETRHLPLSSLSPEEAVGLVSQRLGVTFLPEPVRALIHEKAEGHPFFAEELAYSLRDSGFIRIEGEHARLVTDDLSGLSLPNTVEGVITSRVDRLPPPQQLTIKVASVIGRVFPFRTLQEVYPIQSEPAELRRHLEMLQQLELTPLETPDPDLSYIFKHVITQEVVYNIMLFAQRQQLHRAVADWYESTYADDLAPYYTLLAYHWGKANVNDKAIAYLDKAGTQALQGGSFEEVVRCFSEAITLAELEGSTDRARRVRWEYNLAKGFLGMGRLPNCREHLLLAARMGGSAWPDSPRRLMRAVIEEVIEQVGHRLQGARLKKAPPERWEGMLQLARINDYLADIGFFSNNFLEFLYGNLSAFNLAERTEPSSELARASGSLCVALGRIRMHRLARLYTRLARRANSRMNDLPTRARTLTRISLYAIGVGDWKTAGPCFAEAKEICEGLGDRLQGGESTSLLGVTYLYQGRYPEAIELYEQLYRSAYDRGNVQHQAWGLYRKATAQVRLGRTDEALATLHKATPLFQNSSDRPSLVNYHGMLALSYLRQGRTDDAWSEAQAVLKLIADKPPTASYCLDGYGALVEVLVKLQGQGETGLDPAQLRAATRQARKLLQKLARLYPIGRPQLNLWLGLEAWHEGKSWRAQRAWRRARDAARSLSMPLEEGLAHFEMARHLPVRHPSREDHKQQAQAIFRRLDAAYDLLRLRVLD